MLRRKTIRPGDEVAIVAPAGPFPRNRYERGREVLTRRGYRVVELLPPEARRYLAASDEARAAALTEAFSRPELRAVFAARGGYGTMRILPSVDWSMAAASGKPLVGFSDLTAVHLTLQREGVRSVHGPVVTRLGEEPPDALDRLFAILQSKEAPPPLQGRIVVPGEAEGRLVGGNLSLITRLLGTPYLPSLRGAILLVEEVGERPYRLDRMWTHLRLAGVLDEIAGVAVGDLTDCAEPRGGHGAAEVMDELLLELGKPAIAGLPIGHGEVHQAVVLGARTRLQAGALVQLEGL